MQGPRRIHIQDLITEEVTTSNILSDFKCLKSVSSHIIIEMCYAIGVEVQVSQLSLTKSQNILSVSASTSQRHQQCMFYHKQYCTV